MISFFQAIVMGLLQGLTELFPVSSLGHSVLFAWVAGWNNIVASQSHAESFFLAFLVILHVGTALGLLFFYRDTWVRIIKGFFTSIKKRSITNSSEKLAWLLIIATAPAGLVGIVLEHTLRTQFAKPLAAAVFIMINGLILLGGDYYIRNKHIRQPKRDFHMETTQSHTADHITLGRSFFIGSAQVFALIAGISRSGITMMGGLFSGLDYEDSARFSFLLATPIILGAGVYKLPDFLGKLSNGSRPQMLLGGLVAGVSAYFAVKFLDKYFRNKTFRPFGYYCLAIGFISLLIGLLNIRHF